MRHHHRLTRLVMLLALAGAVTLAGCSKKPAESDVTKTTPAPEGTSTGTTTGQDQGGTPAAAPTGSETSASALRDAFFAYDDYTLSGEARDALSANAGYLRELGSLRVMIEGHCDERGTVEYNLALGQRRADAARSYLVDLGIDGGRISTMSYGEERPFAEGHDESAWSQNRRAHFRVINP